MKLRRELFLRCVLRVVATLSLAIFPAASAFATVTPAKVSSSGYLSGTPFATQTTAEFNSIGSTTLVAFVSTHPVWPQPGSGLPVSISGVTDNMGNVWNLLTGPTTWDGSVFSQLTAIYYVNAPVTSATHTVTVILTNPAPLVVNVFAVSGSDITGPPISSAITDPGPGGTSATVTTAPITAPSSSLLLSWVKNETTATATAADGYTLDSSSTSFLWAETQTAPSTGSYTGQFEYSAAIGWQTAIVGLQPLAVPVAYSEGVSTGEHTPVDITLTALSPQGSGLTYTVLSLPTQGTLSGTAPNLTYSPNTGYVGPDMFTFKANDGTKDTNVATIDITVGAPAVINSVAWLNGTAPYTAQTTPSFNSSGATTLVAFVSSYTEWNRQPGEHQWRERQRGEHLEPADGSRPVDRHTPGLYAALGHLLREFSGYQHHAHGHLELDECCAVGDPRLRSVGVEHHGTPNLLSYYGHGHRRDLSPRDDGTDYGIESLLVAELG